MILTTTFHPQDNVSQVQPHVSVHCLDPSPMSCKNYLANNVIR